MFLNEIINFKGDNNLMLSSELKELMNSIISINRNEVNNLDKDNIEIKTNQGDIIKLVFNNRSYK